MNSTNFLQSTPLRRRAIRAMLRFDLFGGGDVGSQMIDLSPVMGPAPFRFPIFCFSSSSSSSFSHCFYRWGKKFPFHISHHLLFSRFTKHLPCRCFQELFYRNFNVSTCFNHPKVTHATTTFFLSNGMDGIYTYRGATRRLLITWLMKVLMNFQRKTWRWGTTVIGDVSNFGWIHQDTSIFQWFESDFWRWEFSWNTDLDLSLNATMWHVATVAMEMFDCLEWRCFVAVQPAYAIGPYAKTTISYFT